MVFILLKKMLYFIYTPGKFNELGKKNDERGIFYDSSKDRVFIGRIFNDIIQEGHLITFNSTNHLGVNENNKIKNSNKNINNINNTNNQTTNNPNPDKLEKTVDIIFIEFEKNTSNPNIKNVLKFDEIETKLKESLTQESKEIHDKILLEADFKQIYEYIKRAMYIVNLNNTNKILEDVEEYIESKNFVEDMYPMGIYEALNNSII